MKKGSKYAALPTNEVELTQQTNKKNSSEKDVNDSLERGELLNESKNSEGRKEEKKLTLYELFTILSPYFWPSSASENAFMNRVRSSSTWAMVAISKACNIIAPFYLSTATNSLVRGQWVAVVKNCTLYIFLRITSSVCKEMQGVLYIRVKQQATIELQEFIFTHIHHLSLAFHLNKSTGVIMKAMDRGVDAANTLISYLFLFLIPALIECFAVIILFFLSYKQYLLSLIIVIAIVIYAAVTIFLTNYRKKFREETNKHDNDYHNQATDSILNYETVKYFTNEGYEVNKYKQLISKYQKAHSSTQFFLSTLNISQQFVLNLTLLSCMLVAGYGVVTGRMSLGAWIAVQSWVGTVFAPLNFLGSVYSAIFQGFIDIRNLSELLSEQPDITDSPSAQPLPLPYSPLSIPTNPMQLNKPTGVSVEFKQVSFHYPEQPAERGLQEVSFFIKPGATVAIVGHTGAGKTTISRLLFRFFDPLQGAVLINGHDIKQATQRSVRQAIGIVPQDTVLFNDTIYHNISYGNLNATREEVYAAAEAAQVKAFVESLPDQWETKVGERGLKLSGGEKQRVAIARCLLKNPPIVMLDEATSALDTLTENSIQTALMALGKQRTVLIIAHRLSTIRHADMIIVMDRGRVKELGGHVELLNTSGSLYKEMWNMQVQSGKGGYSVEEEFKEGD